MLSIMARGGGEQMVPLELETLDELVDALVEDEATVLDPVDEDVVELCAALEPCVAVELCDAPPPAPPPTCRTTLPEQPACVTPAAIAADSSTRATRPRCPSITSASLPGFAQPPADRRA
jgi:hypothetical protein